MVRIQLVRLLFCMLLYGNQPLTLSLDFKFLASDAIEQFLLVAANDSSYNGSKPLYKADGGLTGGAAVWLIPNPSIPQDLGNFSKTSNVGRFVWKESVSFSQQVGNQEVFASFSTSFQFQIITTGDYGNSGDGLAFFISTQATLPHNSTGDLMGLASRSTTDLAASPASPFFAVEFDTHQDEEMKDPSASHIGIDVNSLISNTTIPNTTDTSLSLYNNHTFMAWVEYNASDHLVQVWIVNDDSNTSTFTVQPPQPSLTLPLDLASVFNGSLLDLYVGFSAATAGSSYGGYAVYSWNFSTINDGISSPTSSDITGSKSISNAGSLHHHTRTSPLFPLLIVFPVAAAVFIVLLLFVIWKIRRRHEKPEPKLEARNGHAAPRANIEMQNKSVPRYSYSELRRATNGFSNRMLVGQGAFSRVYRGTLRVDASTLVVAVKKMHDGLGEEASFPSEMKILSSIRHRNLLQLHGWCYHKGKALLVYEYMENGSLDYHLFKHKEAGVRLSSDTRFNILLGVAAALEYLHEGLGECVLHRDVKAANVLLNKDFQPLLGDFGLARLISDNMMVTTMTAAGTPGYLAPETYFTGKATDRADVYSFGVLALEVACGRRVLDAQLQPQERNLVEWVWLLKQSSKLLDSIDPIMAESIKSITNDADEIQDDYHNRWRCVLHIGLACCHPLPQYRPSMRQVHQLLKKTTIVSLPSTRPDFPYATNSNDAVIPFSVLASSDFSASSSFNKLTKSNSFGS